MSYAWEVSKDDIYQAFIKLGITPTDADVELADAELIHEDVEEAALAGDDMDEQVEYAMQELVDQISKMDWVPDINKEEN